MVGPYRWKPDKPVESALQSMGRCVHCCLPMPSVLRGTAGSGQVVDTCPRCGLVADPYVEHDTVHTTISILLLKPDAWRHAVFNAGPNALVRLALVAAVALLVECVDVAVLGPLNDVSVKIPASPSGTSWLLQPLSAFRLVYLVNNALLFSDKAPGVLIKLLVFALAEMALSLLVMTWLATVLSPATTSHSAVASPVGGASRGSDKQGETKHFAAAAAVPTRVQAVQAYLLTRCLRIGLLVPVVWESPAYFFVLLDLIGAAWYFMALRSLTRCPIVFALVATVFGYSVTDFVFRSATSWAPVLLWSKAML